MAIQLEKENNKFNIYEQHFLIDSKNDLQTIESEYTCHQGDKAELPDGSYYIRHSDDYQGEKWELAKSSSGGGSGGSDLPAVTSIDNGKVLGVVNGEWAVDSKGYSVSESIQTIIAQQTLETMDAGGIYVAQISCDTPPENGMACVVTLNGTDYELTAAETEAMGGETAVYLGVINGENPDFTDYPFFIAFAQGITAIMATSANPAIKVQGVLKDVTPADDFSTAVHNAMSDTIDTPLPYLLRLEWNASASKYEPVGISFSDAASAIETGHGYPERPTMLYFSYGAYNGYFAPANVVRMTGYNGIIADFMHKGLSNSSPYWVHVEWTEADGVALTETMITTGGESGLPSYSAANDGDVLAISSGSPTWAAPSGGDDLCLVRFSGSGENITADKTFAEIMTAIRNKAYIAAFAYDWCYSFSHIAYSDGDPYYLIFQRISIPYLASPAVMDVRYIYIRNNNTIYTYQANYSLTAAN